MSEREPPPTRARYKRFFDVPTRWNDNDVYGHVNNVVYYAYFDTVINRHLIDAGGLDIHGGPVIGLAVESRCRYRRAIAFPTDLEGGLCIAHLGTSSVRYEVGLFPKGEADVAADGWFVHVFVDRATRRPVPLPPALRAALEPLLAR